MSWSSFWSDVGENLSNIFGGSAAARRNAEKQMKDYRNAINQYTGSEGYKNALNQASKETARMAGSMANQAAAQQQSALRSAGQSGNAAAILAGNNASNAYQNAYNQNIQGQQQQAYNAGLNRVDAENQYNTSRTGTAQNNQQQSSKSLQTGLSTAATIFSDEKTKNAISTDDFFKKYKKRDLKDLSVSFGGK